MTLRSAAGFFTVISCLALLGVSSGAGAGDASYLTYLPDVPLMPSMTELSDEATVFDKEEGRVVETSVLAGANTQQEVEAFYRRALQALGWEEADSLRFLRNGEQLIVKWGKKEGAPIVTFSLSPKTNQKQEKNF